MNTVPIGRVSDGPRRRVLSRPTVKALADSIAEIGLLNPISVRAEGEQFRLIAGRHRLEAVRSLGWQEIPAVLVDLDDVDRMLAEIDENLIRNELTELERGEHFAERKRLYLLKHPETAPVYQRGGPGRNGKTTDKMSAVSFAADTAEKTGVDERTVRRTIAIGEMPEDVREQIHDSAIADSQTDLLALARLPEDRQREVVRTADLGDKRAVRQAVADRQTFACRVCGDEQTMKTWHCNGCGEHWLPGDPCGECPSDTVEQVPDDVRPCVVEVETTIAAFAAAINRLFAADERAQLVDLIQEEARQRVER